MHKKMLTYMYIHLYKIKYEYSYSAANVSMYQGHCCCLSLDLVDGGLATGRVLSCKRG